MISTEGGIVMLVSFMQPEKDCFLICFILFGRITDFRALQPEKAYSPMFITLLGNVTEVNARQP